MTVIRIKVIKIRNNEKYEEKWEITWTAIDLKPHGYVFVPSHRSNSYVACSDWFAYFVINDGLSVTITTKDLCKIMKTSGKWAFDQNIDNDNWSVWGYFSVDQPTSTCFKWHISISVYLQRTSGCSNSMKEGAALGIWMIYTRFEVYV